LLLVLLNEFFSSPPNTKSYHTAPPTHVARALLRISRFCSATPLGRHLEVPSSTNKKTCHPERSEESAFSALLGSLSDAPL
jgi:hypothetical protein